MLSALLVLGAVAGALWIAFGGREGPSTGGGELGIVELPAFLNAENLPVGREPGQMAGDLELETIDGGRFRLSDWRGHPILLNFWATWCIPCRREIPVLIRLQEQYREAGLLIVGVNIEETRDQAQGFVDEFGINYVIPMDFSGEVTRYYLRIGPPNTYFIRPDGIMQDVFLGQAPDDVFEDGAAGLVAMLDAAVGPALLPGLKALPAPLQADAGPVGVEPGQTAPDFVLRRADGSGPWRLSDQRGGMLLLALPSPDGPTCGDEVKSALRSAASAAVSGVLIAETACDPGQVDVQRLLPQADVSARYATSSPLTLVAIDGNGVVLASGADIDAVLSSFSQSTEGRSVVAGGNSAR